MTFAPNRTLITAITQANPAVVTCSTDHNLTTGQVIRLNIPRAYGMQELNNQLVQVTPLSDTTFSIQTRQVPEIENVNSVFFQAFVNAGTGTPAAFVAVGSAPTPLTFTPVQVLRGEAYDSIQDQTVNNSTSPIPF